MICFLYRTTLIGGKSNVMCILKNSEESSIKFIWIIESDFHNLSMYKSMK